LQSLLGNLRRTIDTLMEWSHVPLSKWALAFHTLAANMRRMSVKQLQRAS
jgi:hypothetical protein